METQRTIGFRSHDVSVGTLEDLIRKAHDNEVRFFQLALDKSLVGLDLTSADLAAIGQQLRANDLQVGLLSNYFNPVHPNREKVDTGLGKWEALASSCEAFGCRLIGTETGSLNGDKWSFHQDNHTPATLAKFLAVLTKIIEISKKYDTLVAIEPAWNHVVYNLKTTRQMVKLMGTRHLRLTIDPFNLINGSGGVDYLGLTEQFMAAFSPLIAVVHLKDFIITADGVKQVPLGSGVVDFGALFALAKKYGVSPFYVLEGTNSDYQAALAGLEAL